LRRLRRLRIRLMSMKDLPSRLTHLVENVISGDELSVMIGEMARELGFCYYALSHHVDAVAVGGDAIRLHNYPPRWAAYYEEHALGLSDPVHRACQVTNIAFCWAGMADMIPLTRSDERTLALGRAHGIGDGVTVPTAIAGEVTGSCSFAVPDDRRIAQGILPWAHMVGEFAFAAARRLWTPRGQRSGALAPILTDRQRDCVLWIARGKSNWEIAHILEIGVGTVNTHVKQAYDRYGVHDRTSLVIRALFDGTLSFADIFRRKYLPYRR